MNAVKALLVLIVLFVALCATSNGILRPDQKPDTILLGHQGPWQEIQYGRSAIGYQPEQQVVQMTQKTTCAWCNYGQTRQQVQQVQQVQQPQCSAPDGCGKNVATIPPCVWIIAPTELQRYGVDANGEAFHPTQETLDGLFATAFQTIGVNPKGFIRFYPEQQLSYYPSEAGAQAILGVLNPGIDLQQIQDICDANANNVVALSPDKQVLAAASWGPTLAKMLPNGQLQRDQHGNPALYDSEVVYFLSDEGVSSIMYTRGVDAQFIRVNPRQAL